MGFGFEWDSDSEWDSTSEWDSASDSDWDSASKLEERKPASDSTSTSTKINLQTRSTCIHAE